MDVFSTAEIKNLTDLEKSILQEAICDGKLKADVSDTINDMRKEKVLSVHPFTITKLNNAKGLYQTFIIDEGTEKRKKITAATETDLFKKLYDIYFVQNASTLRTLYPDWLERRSSIGISPRTVKRNKDHWNKYYLESAIIDKPLHKITSEMIEDFFHKTIKKFDLTAKELGNMKFIMTDMMKLAKRRDLISYNPFLDVEISLNGCRPVTKHNDVSRVYLPDEKEKLFVALRNELQAHPEVTDMYAIMLLFKLGLRAGELVALRWSDIDYKNRELHIHHMATLMVDESDKFHETVVDYTKRKSPYGDRFLPLSDYELMLFGKVKAINNINGYEDEDFIFCDHNGRTNIRSIDNRIRKCCEKAGIVAKSAHDIRRTVASEMFNKGIPVEIIRNYLGHSDIKTTFGYILDNHKKEDTNRMIREALAEMNALPMNSAI